MDLQRPIRNLNVKCLRERDENRKMPSQPQKFTSKLKWTHAIIQTLVIQHVEMTRCNKQTLTEMNVAIYFEYI